MPAADRDRPRLCRVAGREAWHIYHARRRVSTGCTDRAAAELVLARYLGELGRPQLAVVSIATILERYLADRTERGTPGAERLRWAHKPLARILGPRPPEAVTEADCLAYAARRARESIAAATIRTELQAGVHQLPGMIGKGRLGVLGGHGWWMGLKWRSSGSGRGLQRSGALVDAHANMRPPVAHGENPAGR